MLQNFLIDYYLIFKALHVISFVAWMAGLFYLPRLFVYHCQVAPLSEASEKFKTMEVKLLRVIMNPAMIATWTFGLAMVYGYPEYLSQGWMHIKLTCVFILSGFHGYLAKTRKDFAADKNQKTEKFFRIINEVPTVFLIIIVFMVVLMPF